MYNFQNLGEIMPLNSSVFYSNINLNGICISCDTRHNLIDSQNQVSKRGVLLAICGKTVFQVIDCCSPGCNGKVVFYGSNHHPAVDMSCLLLVPNKIGIYNRMEQSWILRNWDDWHDYLKFDFIPVWDTSCVNVNDFIMAFDYLFEFNGAFPNSQLSFQENNSELLTTQDIKSDTICLRRLIPDTIYNRKLVNCLSPYKVYDIDDNDNINDGQQNENYINEDECTGASSKADGNSPQDLTEKEMSWRYLFAEFINQTLENSIIKELSHSGFQPPNLSEISKFVVQYLSFEASNLKLKLWDIVSKHQFSNNAKDVLINLFYAISKSICSKIIISYKREDLTKWSTEVKQGQAIFIDAPMGLGKSTSIVETLATNPNLSAIIFLPTKQLCMEITEKLKNRIASIRCIDIWAEEKPTIYDYNGDFIYRNDNDLLYKEPVTKLIDGKSLYDEKNNPLYIFDDDGLPLYDENGFPFRNNSSFLYRFKKDFLNSEVYYLEGINKDECLHFEEIVELYKNLYFKKNNICRKCEIYDNCRFIIRYQSNQNKSIEDQSKHKHIYEIIKSRIIVTTHHQYHNVFNNKIFHRWNNQRKIKYDEMPLRDMFIIDEDIVLSQLYKPVTLDIPSFKKFIGTIDDYLVGHEISAETHHIIHSLYTKLTTCEKTSIIKGIDPDFYFSKNIHEAWEKSFNNQFLIIPEYIESDKTIGNYLRPLEQSIRFGAVVEKWKMSKDYETHKIHLPNPRSYNLSDAPPHVFFDGTMLEPKFLEHKLKGVEFNNNIKINVNIPWELNVYQNTNSDLPARKVSKNQANIQKLLVETINQLPIDKKIFIITTKIIYNTYLNDFVTKNFHPDRIVCGYFGNIRGLNNAENCNVCIMLGSFSPSDAVEIAMAIEFIGQNSLKKPITVAEGNLWAWKNKNFVRNYNNKFSVVGEMAKAYRHSEHRQALARTRYLNHNVDFYIISKDPVSEYDPYLTSIKDNQFRADLFPIRKKREDGRKNYNKIQSLVFEYLKVYEKITPTKIERIFGIGRHTAAKHLKEMVADGHLIMEKMSYKLAPQNNE